MSSIITYGHKVLRQVCDPVYEVVNANESLIEGLWFMLRTSGGVGLAAPQINSSKNVFVVDSTLVFNELDSSQRKSVFSGDQGIKSTFINACIIATSEECWSEREACLSIPGIYEPVIRPWEIIVEYQDRNFKFQRRQYAGYTARVIQHELDHTQGILFIDHLPAIRKKLIKRKLNKIQTNSKESTYHVHQSKLL